MSVDLPAFAAELLRESRVARLGTADRAGAVDLLRAKYAQYRALGLDRETATVIRISPERTLFWSWDG